MNTQPRYEKEDILINFRDMLLYILLRWRSILAAMLVLAVLLGGFKYWKDYTGWRAMQDTQSSELTEESLVKVKTALNRQRSYEAQSVYNAEALFMQINAGAAPTEVITYLITGEQSYLTASLYQKYVNDQALYRKACDTIEADFDCANMQDLITAYTEYDISTTMVENSNLPVLLNIKVIAPEKEQCRQIAQTVIAHVDALKSTISNAMGKHSCTLAGDTYSVVNDTTLKNKQKENIDNVTALETAMTEAEGQLNASERAYLEKLVSEENVTDSAPARPQISKKYVAVGLLGGLVLFVFLYGLGYVFNKRVKSREDLAERYGLYVFGTMNLPQDTVKRRTDARLRRLFDKKTAPQETDALLRQQVLLAGTATDTDAPVFVTGSALTAAQATAFDQLKKDLAENHVTLDCAPCPLYNAAAMEQLSKAGAVVLAETVGASDYDDIYREIELCNRLDKPILGLIVLQ